MNESKRHSSPRFHQRAVVAAVALAIAAASLFGRANAVSASGAFTESPIVMHTATGDIYGTLTMPVAPKGAVPVVLIIAGSGPTDRDGNSAGFPGKMDTYKLLAHALAARGLASVRYDKRFIGASAAAASLEKDLRFDTYVDDAAGWISMLHGDPRFARIIVAGHSEGSLIGAIASERGNVSAYVSLDGAGRPAAAVLREQLRNAPAPLYAQANAIMTQLERGSLYTKGVPESFMTLFRPSVQPYLISWFKYDPAVEVAKLRIPVTIVQGTADVQAGIVDARALAAADPRAKLVLVDGMNHVLKHAPDTSSQAVVIAGYTNPNLPIEPKVIDAIVASAGR